MRWHGSHVFVIPMNQLHSFAQFRGVTLTEVMIVIAIIGILAGIAVPSYQDMIERNRLKQAAESLADDLKYARTEAIKRSCNTTLSFVSPGYKISTVANGSCTASTVLKTVDISQFSSVSFSSTNNVTFVFTRGTSANLSSTVSSTHYTAQVVTESSGRVYICTSGGKLGYPSC